MERVVNGVLKFDRATAEGVIRLDLGSWSNKPVGFWIYSDRIDEVLSACDKHGGFKVKGVRSGMITEINFRDEKEIGGHYFSFEEWKDMNFVNEIRYDRITKYKFL